MKQTVIEINETDNEYLLKIPPWQKERAKEIDGRRWDPERKVWVYPRTPQIYRALLTEFGDDSQAAITLPGTPTIAPATAKLEEQNADLHKQLQVLNGQVEGLLSAKSDEDKTAAFQSTIARQQAEIAELKRADESNTTEIARLNKAIETAEQQVTKIDASDFEKSLIEIAIACTGNNQEFAKNLRQTGVTDKLPIEFQKILIKRLRTVLKEPDANFFELLVQAEDSELFPPEAIDLAHAIRKQRNILMHHDIESKTRPLRVIYFVIAYALLWPLLDEVES